MTSKDILSTLDFYQFFQAHQSGNAIATLATRQRTTSRYLIFNKKNQLCGWTNIKTGVVKMVRPVTGELQLRAFSGIQIIDPRLFDFFSKKDRFSIIDTYLKAAAETNILCFPDSDSLWLDVGKPPAIEAAGKIIREILTNNIIDKF